MASDNLFGLDSNLNSDTVHNRRFGGFLLVAGRGPLHAGETKVSMAATQPGALPVFELTAGAETLHLQPVQEERQAEWETAVAPRHKLERL